MSEKKTRYQALYDQIVSSGLIETVKERINTKPHGDAIQDVEFVEVGFTTMALRFTKMWAESGTKTFDIPFDFEHGEEEYKLDDCEGFVREMCCALGYIVHPRFKEVYDKVAALSALRDIGVDISTPVFKGTVEIEDFIDRLDHQLKYGNALIREVFSRIPLVETVNECSALLKEQGIDNELLDRFKVEPLNLKRISGTSSKEDIEEALDEMVSPSSTGFRYRALAHTRTPLCAAGTMRVVAAVLVGIELSFYYLKAYSWDIEGKHLRLINSVTLPDDHAVVQETLDHEVKFMLEKFEEARWM